MNHAQTTRPAMCSACLLGFCLIWAGCSGPTFYPVRYDPPTGPRTCDRIIKLYIGDVTATGAIDDGGILLQRPNGSLRHDRSKQWRDLPTELFQQAVMSACLSDRWKKNFTTVASPAQADLSITVHLRAFYVKVGDCQDPTGAMAEAIVQFAPKNGEPSAEEITGHVDSSSTSANPYSAAMGQALTDLVDGILERACGKGASNHPPSVPPQVATIPAWDSLLQRDVGVVIELGAAGAGTISTRNRFGAAIVELAIRQWRFQNGVATFDVTSPWSIPGATMELLEDSSKKNSSERGRLLLRFKKIPGMKEFEVKDMTREAVAGELGKF